MDLAFQIEYGASRESERLQVGVEGYMAQIVVVVSASKGANEAFIDHAAVNGGRSEREELMLVMNIKTGRVNMSISAIELKVRLEASAESDDGICLPSPVQTDRERMKMLGPARGVT